MKVENLGDRGIVLRFDESPSPELTRKLIGLAESAASIEGVVDACPGHRTILIEVTPELKEKVLVSIPSLSLQSESLSSRRWSVPCIYDGEDLRWMSQHLGLEAKEIARIHAEREYTVMVVASPRFVYLSEVHPQIAVPRLADPRMNVPAGSVGIGGRQTGIYGLARPGGWRIIGRVEELPDLAPGDTIQFKPA